MSKFQSLLKQSGKAVRSARAVLIEENAKYEAEELLRKKRDELRKLKMQENEMTDFYPESEFTLRVTKKHFDAKQWFVDLCELQLKIANTEIEIEIVEKAFNEWFGETKSSE